MPTLYKTETLFKCTQRQIKASFKLAFPLKMYFQVVYISYELHFWSFWLIWCW